MQKLGNARAELIQFPLENAFWSFKTLGYPSLYDIFSHPIPASFSLLDRHLSLSKQLVINFPLLNVQCNLFVARSNFFPNAVILIIRRALQFQHQVLRSTNRVQLRQTNRWVWRLCCSSLGAPFHLLSKWQISLASVHTNHLCAGDLLFGEQIIS